MNSESFLDLIDKFIDDNIVDYFLVNEEQYKVHKAWVEMEIINYIETHSEQILTMNEEEIMSVLYREIKSCLFTNEELIQREEDLEIHNYLLENLHFTYIKNPKQVKEDFLKGRIKIDFEE